MTPSRRIGNFFTGTVWFQPAQSARLIALGYGDMQRALATCETDPGSRTDRSFGSEIAIDPAIG